MIRKVLARERDRLAETEDSFHGYPLLIEQGWTGLTKSGWIYVTEDTS